MEPSITILRRDEFITLCATASMKQNAKLSLIESPKFIYSTDSKRAEYCIVIFPSRPYFFTATRNIVPIIKLFNRNLTYSEILSCSEEAGIINSSEIANQLQTMLNRMGILYINGKCNPPSELTPDKNLTEYDRLIMLQVTNACNLKCKHCYADAGKRKTNELTLEEIKNVIDDVATMKDPDKMGKINVTGGEPLLRDDILDITSYISKRGLMVDFSTNGLLLTDEVLESFCKLDRIALSISLDGATKSTHEYMRGPDTFLRTINILKKVKEYELELGITFVVHKKNFHELEKLFQLCKRMKINSINIINANYLGRMLENSIEPVPELNLFKRLFSLSQKNPDYYKLMSRIMYIQTVAAIKSGMKAEYCGVGYHKSMYVDSIGDIYPCPNTHFSEFKLGNVRKNKISKIWNISTKLYKLRNLSVDKMNKKCSNCYIRYYCGGGCRGETYSVFKDIRKPYVKCDSYRKGIIEILWQISENPSFCIERANYFIKQANQF
jgi:radical SAM protein with 4Fe4S-binding SPASM domain